MIDQTIRDALRTQLYLLKSKAASKPALPARPNAKKEPTPSIPPDHVLVDLSDKVQEDLLLSDKFNNNPFLQHSENLHQWVPLEPEKSSPNDLGSLNPFRNLD